MRLAANLRNATDGALRASRPLSHYRTIPVISVHISAEGNQAGRKVLWVRKMIDTTEIREMTVEDFAKGCKNPYAEKLREHGYSIIINVSPEDIVNMTTRNVEIIRGMDMLELDPDERRALEMYKAANQT